MRTIAPTFALILAAAQPAAAQATDSITLYEYPAFFGRSVTISAATPDLATQSFAKTARSARVVGSWTVCREPNYTGCSTLTADQQTLFLVGLDKAITSLKPTNEPATATAATTTGATTTTLATGTTTATTDKVDLTTMNIDAGRQGQDTEFYPTPSFARTQVSAGAGANDKAAGDAFCKAAGYVMSSYAGHGRVQAVGLIDLATSTKIRAYPLRDVLCHR